MLFTGGHGFAQDALSIFPLDFLGFVLVRTSAPALAALNVAAALRTGQRIVVVVVDVSSRMLM